MYIFSRRIEGVAILHNSFDFYVFFGGFYLDKIGHVKGKGLNGYTTTKIISLKTRIADHISREPVKEPFLKCDSDICFDCIDIFASTN